MDTNAALARLLEALEMDDNGDNRSEVLAALEDLRTLIARGGVIPHPPIARGAATNQGLLYDESDENSRSV